jgi:hypothetical protein
VYTLEYYIQTGEKPKTKIKGDNLGKVRGQKHSCRAARMKITLDFSLETTQPRE